MVGPKAGEQLYTIPDVKHAVDTVHGLCALRGDHDV